MFLGKIVTVLVLVLVLVLSESISYKLLNHLFLQKAAAFGVMFLVPV